MAMALSGAIVLAQVVFQVVMFTTAAQPRCQRLEYLLRHIGMILLYNMEYIDLLWFLPDVVMLLASVVLFVVLRALTKPLSQHVVDGADASMRPAASATGTAAVPPSASTADAANDDAAGNGSGPRSSSGTTNAAALLPAGEVLALRKQFGTFLALVSLLLVAAVRPSVPSAVYFLVFLGASTWWACFKELDRLVWSRWAFRVEWNYQIA